MKMKHVNKFKLNEASDFGNVTINIEGNGYIKKFATEKIKMLLYDLIGEKHLFIDGVEVDKNMINRNNDIFKTDV